MAYILGTKHTGKTTTLANLALQSISEGEAVLYIGHLDIPTDTFTHLTNYIPQHRWDDTIVFDPHSKTPVTFNPLRSDHDKPLLARNLRDLFRDLAGYIGASTARFDRLIYNTLSAVLDVPDTTILDMLFFIIVDNYRQTAKQYITDPFVRAFWELQFERWSERNKEERTESTLAQIDTFATDREIRNSLCYQHATLTDLTNKVTLVNPTNKVIVLTLLASVIGKDVTVFIDDVLPYQGQTLINLLNNNTVHLTNSDHTQLRPEVGNAILNSSEEKIFLRLGGDDAERFDRMLKISNTQKTSLGELPYFKYFSAGRYEPLPPLGFETVKGASKAIRSNMKRYTTPRQKIEASIESKANEVFGWTD